MISTFSLIIAAMLMVVDPAVKNTAHETVTVLPAQNFVLCEDNCFQPTPKEKKIVLKRIEKPAYSMSFSKINDYLKTKAEGAATSRIKSDTVSRSIVLMPHTVYFDLDSAIISEKEKVKILDWIGKNKAVRYEVSGYTCQLGTEKHNQSLSEKRADSVRKYLEDNLKSLSVSVTAKGMGMGHYISIKDYALNRRAEIKAISDREIIPPKVSQQKTKKVVPEQDSARSQVKTIVVKKQPVKIIRIDNQSKSMEKQTRQVEPGAGNMPAKEDVQGQKREGMEVIKVMKPNKAQPEEIKK